MTRCLLAALVGLSVMAGAAIAETNENQNDDIPPLPENARLVLVEDWSSGKIDPAKWYVPRKRWGDNNHGVTPENVSIETDAINGGEVNVLVCRAHGDEYDGPIVGQWGKKERVGGMIVSQEHLASGRFEVVMKIGSTQPREGGPENPMRPIGAVPAIWTYGYRFIEAPREQMHEFTPEIPLYNPHMRVYDGPYNEYWSELDFPEFGKDGDFSRAFYNTFCQNQHEWRLLDVGAVADGQYHTYTTEWRTTLKPMPGVTDEQVIEHEGFWWVQDKSVPFHEYLGNPLKRVGKNEYKVYWGEAATHWIDGKKIGENRRFVPAMAGQLTFGIWLPNWAGPAPWKTSRVSFASVKVWQYDDPGDVRGVLTENLANSFDEHGNELQ